jgi:hypothetical protein
MDSKSDAEENQRQKNQQNQQPHIETSSLSDFYSVYHIALAPRGSGYLE